MYKVLFVCHGNICRSVMAEYICKQLRPEIYCESRAVSYEEEGMDIYPPAKKCLDYHGIKYGKHQARRIRQEDYDKFDIIYVMDRSNMTILNRIIDDKDDKIRLLCKKEIEDPWYTGKFEHVYNQLTQAIENIRIK